MSLSSGECQAIPATEIEQLLAKFDQLNQRMYNQASRFENMGHKIIDTNMPQKESVGQGIADQKYSNGILNIFQVRLEEYEKWLYRNDVTIEKLEKLV
jgi:hypothetical protein